MIKARDGRKITPRQKAREILMDGMAEALHYDATGMTDLEVERVSDQLIMIINGLARKWGFLELMFEDAEPRRD
jgi:hypothetical protein